MATMTTTFQESTVGEGLAAGCIANGVVAVSANKQYKESSFVNAWRDWRCANQFPAVHASLARNDLRTIVATPGSSDGATTWTYYPAGGSEASELAMTVPSDYTQVPPPANAVVPPGGKIPIMIWNGSEKVASHATCPSGGATCLTYPRTLPVPVIDARRASAIMRALGARARQVSLGLIAAQVISAIPGTLIGVGLGIALYSAAVKSQGGPLPVLWLAITVLGTLAVVAALTMVPASLGTRQPVAEVFASEAA
jgi:hypothetical protein